MDTSPPNTFNKVSREEFDRILALNSLANITREGWANGIVYTAHFPGEVATCAYLMDDGTCHVHPFLKTE